MEKLINGIYDAGIIGEALFGVKKSDSIDRLSVFQRSGRRDEMKVEVSLQFRRPFAHALVIDLLLRFHIPGHADCVQSQFIGDVERAGQMETLRDQDRLLEAENLLRAQAGLVSRAP